MPELPWHNGDEVVQRPQNTDTNLPRAVSPYSPLTTHTPKSHTLPQLFIYKMVGEPPAFWENTSVPGLYRLKSACSTVVEVPDFNRDGQRPSESTQTPGVKCAGCLQEATGPEGSIVLTHRDCWWWWIDPEVPKTKVNSGDLLRSYLICITEGKKRPCLSHKKWNHRLFSYNLQILNLFNNPEPFKWKEALNSPASITNIVNILLSLSQRDVKLLIRINLHWQTGKTMTYWVLLNLVSWLILIPRNLAHHWCIRQSGGYWRSKEKSSFDLGQPHRTSKGPQTFSMVVSPFLEWMCEKDIFSNLINFLIDSLEID